MVSDKGKKLGNVKIRSDNFKNEKGENEDANVDVYQSGDNKALALWVKPEQLDNLKDQQDIQFADPALR